MTTNLIGEFLNQHNLSLVRLGGAKKCLFVEGKDIKLLSKFHEILYPTSNEALDQLPTVELGGWSRFGEALGAARLFFEETDGEIETFCILDRDYHSQEEVDKLTQRAEESHLQLHIWKRKEIENYILTPRSIFKLTDQTEEKYPEFKAELCDQLGTLYAQTLGNFLDQFQHEFKGQNASTNLELATQELAKRWGTLEGRLSVCNGKDAISLINHWIRERYHKNSSQARLFKALSSEDIPEEVRSVINLLTRR
jgi:hypothetical protein